MQLFFRQKILTHWKEQLDSIWWRTFFHSNTKRSYRKSFLTVGCCRLHPTFTMTEINCKNQVFYRLPDFLGTKYFLPCTYNFHFSHQLKPKCLPKNAQNFSIASQIYTVCFTVLHKTFHQMHDFSTHSKYAFWATFRKHFNKCFNYKKFGKKLDFIG